MSGRISYNFLRPAALFVGGFNLCGSIPRTLGIVSTKPEYATFIAWLDGISLTALAAITVTILWALVTMPVLNRNE